MQENPMNSLNHIREKKRHHKKRSSIYTIKWMKKVIIHAVEINTYTHKYIHI